MKVTRVKGNDPEFVKEFKDCFGELGILPKTHHIEIDSSVSPVVQTPRPIPIGLHSWLKTEFDKMKGLEIIRKIDNLTSWASNLVVVEKPNKSLRICLDPKDLSKAIKRHHCRMPTPEEIFSKMTGTTVFSKLDATNAYWQVKVDDESAALLTFATPFGNYQFK